MLERNQRIQVQYPVSTLVNAPLEFRPRRLIVKSIRDLLYEPLSPHDFFRRPLVRRSRFLITARDLGRGTIQQFYLGTCQEYFRQTPLRIALYDLARDRPRPVELLSKPFEPEVRDRLVMARVLRKLLCRDFGHLVIRAFSDDLRVIGRAG